MRRKTFAAAPMTVEEAAFDLDILDHDFYLFEELKSGEPGLLSVQADGRYELAIAHSADIEADPAMPLDRVDGPMVLNQKGAQRLLDEGEDAFIFHRANEGQIGQVMYRRYDGNYGVVELGVASRTPVDSA